MLAHGVSSCVPALSEGRSARRSLPGSASAHCKRRTTSRNSRRGCAGFPRWRWSAATTALQDIRSGVSKTSARAFAVVVAGAADGAGRVEVVAVAVALHRAPRKTCAALRRPRRPRRRRGRSRPPGPGRGSACRRPAPRRPRRRCRGRRCPGRPPAGGRSRRPASCSWPTPGAGRDPRAHGFGGQRRRRLHVDLGPSLARLDRPIGLLRLHCLLHGRAFPGPRAAALNGPAPAPWSRGVQARAVPSRATVGSWPPASPASRLSRHRFPWTCPPDCGG